MSMTETLEAFEEGLITEYEALEQALVDSVAALYESAAASGYENAEKPRRAALATTSLHRS